MELISTTYEMIADQVTKVASTAMQCFTETPRKTGEEKPLSRISAFDLFNLFTAEVIRSREIFTR